MSKYIKWFTKKPKCEICGDKKEIELGAHMTVPCFCVSKKKRGKQNEIIHR